MANQYNRRSICSPKMFQILLLITVVQLLFINVEAQGKQVQYESVIGPNQSLRSSTTVAPNDDEEAYEGPDIYDDNDELVEMSSTLNPKNPANKPSQFNSQSDDSNKHEYADESENYQSDDPIEDDGGHPDENNLFVDENSSPTDIDLNQNKNFDTPPSTNSRLPFVPASLWRDLFTKPGILVGIIGGIVIGMLSAILLVMFIIYRMRKKDEGSYALEEGPRKSPSHAYTRVSSREFFA